MKKYIIYLIYFILGIILSIVFKNNLIAFIIIRVIAFLCIFKLLINNYEYYIRLMYILIILLNPFWGTLIYLTFGRNSNDHNVYKDKYNNDKMFSKYEIKGKKPETYYETIVTKLTAAKLYKNNKLTLLENGNNKYTILFEKIKKAKKFIHMEYYIISDGMLIDELILLFEEKIKDDVEIRIMYDYVGSDLITNQTIQRLKKIGVQIEPFGKFLLPFFSNKFNYRNHRKICVIDNEYAFIGGMNIDDEYLGYSKRLNSFWRDTQLMIEGPAVSELSLTFLKDWYFLTKENLFLNINIYLKEPPVQGESNIQILNTGADYKEINLKDIYLKLIGSAKKNIMIKTPYFIPDYDLLNALLIASKSGIKVDIILPEKPDNIFVHSVTRTYYDQLLKANINIYEVKDTFIHSKILLIDEEFCMIGSPNVDFRSFNLNFETMGFFDEKKVINDLINQTNLDVFYANKIEINNWNKRPIINRICANIIQIISPIL